LKEKNRFGWMKMRFWLDEDEISDKEL